MAQRKDNTPNKSVYLMYLTGGLLAFYLLLWTIEWIWGYFSLSPSQLQFTVVAFAIVLFIGVWLYRNERVYNSASEIAAEVKKVTWPTSQEVRAATIVVIVTTIIAATILGLFDAAWSRLTTMIYG